MPPPSHSLHPSATRRSTRREVLVAALLGVGLVAAGWADLSSYRLGTRQTVASFGLLGEPGDTRIGEDEFFHRGAIIIHLHNVGGVERNGEEPFRHALGPTVTIETWSTLALEQVDFTLDCGFEQDLTVAHNGQTLEQVHLAPGRVERSYHVRLRPGVNRFTLTFAVYNRHGIEFDGGEARPLAGTFHRLNVHF